VNIGPVLGRQWQRAACGYGVGGTIPLGNLQHWKSSAHISSLTKCNAGGKGHPTSPTCSNVERRSSLLYARGGEATALVRNHLLSDIAKEKAEMTFQACFFSAAFCLFPSLKVIFFKLPVNFAGAHISGFMTE